VSVEERRARLREIEALLRGLEFTEPLTSYRWRLESERVALIISLPRSMATDRSKEVTR
jgi:hypothetical protein